MHVNVVTIGDYSINAELAKKSSSTDITIYHRRIDDDVITLIEPTKYPEKFQPLIKAIAYADAAIVNPVRIDSSLAEALITLDLMGMKNIIVVSNHESIKQIAGDLGRNYKYMDIYDALSELRQIDPTRLSDSTLVVVDQAFNVKSVGTVVLGFVKGGKVRVHDRLKLMPRNIDVEVRSIQIQDVNYDEADLGVRVGLALKGVDVDDIEEGDVLCSDCHASNSISGPFIANKYFKEAQGQMHAAIGSKIRPIKTMKLEGQSSFVELDSPITVIGNRAAIMKLDAKLPRIAGAIIL
ncbi:hypothetical protein GCM10007981_08440 [Thermocladium modestius]|uniref:Translation elongation factor EFTu-like domain-containing protein n=1 Tax=Thermocladium modestius TaxID=62609 RepID=A0A830GUU2_9CREN|nr:EF-Tu/IF-2/RF-3 family GTPase [Thermocladium modestius]GGP20424.1 hypothetical protein GCM10007981_08440 [Thermocladium modestius]